MLKNVRIVLLLALCLPWLAWGASFDESVSGDMSDNGLNPATLALTYGDVGNNGLLGNNVITGRIGRVNGIIDRDYLHIIVPVGYVWSSLLVGNQTTVGGTASFIGLAAGNAITIDPNTATTATGLMGYKLFGTADRSKDILPAMAVSGNGSSGFFSPLTAGDYTLWIQELTPGNFTYKFNLILTAVPEPQSLGMFFLGFMMVIGLLKKRHLR